MCVPTGIKELGYTEQDIPEIIKGAMKQERLLSIAPKNVSENDLNQILIQSMENWYNKILYVGADKKI